jgi:hypothetical protein
VFASSLPSATFTTRSSPRYALVRALRLFRPYFIIDCLSQKAVASPALLQLLRSVPKGIANPELHLRRAAYKLINNVPMPAEIRDKLPCVVPAGSGMADARAIAADQIAQRRAAEAKEVLAASKDEQAAKKALQQAREKEACSEDDSDSGSSSSDDGEPEADPEEAQQKKQSTVAEQARDDVIKHLLIVHCEDIVAELSPVGRVVEAFNKVHSHPRARWRFVICQVGCLPVDLPSTYDDPGQTDVFAGRTGHSSTDDDPRQTDVFTGLYKHCAVQSSQKARMALYDLPYGIGKDAEDILLKRADLQDLFCHTFNLLSSGGILYAFCSYQQVVISP